MDHLTGSGSRNSLRLVRTVSVPLVPVSKLQEGPTLSWFTTGVTEDVLGLWEKVRESYIVEYGVLV